MDMYGVIGLMGYKRLEDASPNRVGDTVTYYGTATSDSDGGTVAVWLSDDVVQPDGELGTSVEMPTTVQVKSGDTVMVTMVATGNALCVPIVTGVVGGEQTVPAHKHSASDITSGVLGRQFGGTGSSGRSDGEIARNTSNCSSLGTSWLSANGVTASVSFIDAKLTNALSNNGNVVVATLPVGFRPRANRYACCIEKAGLWARITASGEVRISNRTGSSYAAGSTFTFSDSYDI